MERSTSPGRTPPAQQACASTSLPASQRPSASWPLVKDIDQKAFRGFQVVAAGSPREAKGTQAPARGGEGAVTLKVYLSRTWCDANVRLFRHFRVALAQDFREALGEALAGDTEFRTGAADTARGLLRVPSALAPLEVVMHADLDVMGQRLQARLVSVLEPPPKPLQPGVASSSSMSSSLTTGTPAGEDPAGDPGSPCDEDAGSEASPVHDASSQPLKPLTLPAVARDPRPASPPPLAQVVQASFDQRFEFDGKKASYVLAATGSSGTNLLKVVATRFASHSFDETTMGVKVDPAAPLLRRIPADRMLHILFGDLNAQADAGGSHLHPHQYPYTRDGKNGQVPRDYAWRLERRFWNARVGMRRPVIHSYFPQDYRANDILDMAVAALEEKLKGAKGAKGSKGADLPKSFSFTAERHGLAIGIRAVLDDTGPAGVRIRSLYPCDKPAQVIRQLAGQHAKSFTSMDWVALAAREPGDAYNDLADWLESGAKDLTGLTPEGREQLRYHVAYLGCLLRVVHPERYRAPTATF